MSVHLEHLYYVLGWPEDPETEEGQRRYRYYLHAFSRLLDHEWLRALLGLRKVEAVELCAGTGLGSAALAAALREKGLECCVLLVDLRESALQRGVCWLQQQGIAARALVADVRRLHTLGRRFDIALMVGYSAVHFDPWEMVRLLASVSAVLKPSGVLVVEEVDRRGAVIVRDRYRRVLLDQLPRDLVVTVHRFYEPRRGVVTRTALRLLDPSIRIEHDVFLWGIAELAALTWCFFHDIDLVKLDQPHHFLLLAKAPRGSLGPEDFASMPVALHQ